MQWFVKVGTVVPWGAAREPQKLIKVEMVVMVIVVVGGKGGVPK